MGAAFSVHLAPWKARVTVGCFRTFSYHSLSDPCTGRRYSVLPSRTNQTGRVLFLPDTRPVTVSSISSVPWRAFTKSAAAMSGVVSGVHAGSRERLDERLGVPGAVVAHAVDEERGRAIDPAADAGHEVLAYPRLPGVLGQLRHEARQVEVEDLRIAHQIPVLERVLVREEQVVHLPELAL